MTTTHWLSFFGQSGAIRRTSLLRSSTSGFNELTINNSLLFIKIKHSHSSSHRAWRTYRTHARFRLRLFFRLVLYSFQIINLRLESFTHVDCLERRLILLSECLHAHLHYSLDYLIRSLLFVLYRFLHSLFHHLYIFSFFLPISRAVLNQRMLRYSW